LAGRVAEAESLFDQGYSAAQNRGDDLATVRFLSAIGACKFAEFQYRAALDAYLRVQRKADQLADYGQAATAALNASSIFLQMRSTGAAAQTAEQALQYFAKTGIQDKDATALTQLAWIRSLEGKRSEAYRLYEQAITRASMRSETAPEALAWHRLGTDLLEESQFASAEEALLTAYRIRFLSHDPSLGTTYYQLARLDLAKGDLKAASNLIDRAIDSGVAGRRFPSYAAFAVRGRIRSASGDLEGALADFRSAVRDASQWRGQVLPADSFRVSAETMLAEVYAGEVEAAAELYFRTQDSRYLVESWEASEANRALSLYAQIGSRRDRLPAEYWETLASLQSIESRLVSSPASQSNSVAALRSQAAALRFRLTELEMRSGLGPSPVISGENFRTQISLSHFRKVVGNSRTLVSFYLGPTVSYRWVVSKSQIALKKLPARREITDLVDRFRAEVRNGAPGSMTAGRHLYSVLLEGVPMEPRHWLLALDGKLFEAPLAALVTDEDGAESYLVEKVVLETTPGAWAVGAAPLAPRSGPFLAVGDPIYNAADPRIGSGSELITRTVRVFRGAENITQLPRLVGSATEAVNCARTWDGGESILLMGTSANPRAFRQALESKPAVIHIAAHFLRSDDEERTVIALSLRRSGGRPVVDVLTPADIATLHADGSLVVLSGCSSGAGRVQAGAGLLGLARAWLTAGARAVVSSAWPVPDDSGELFQDFYRRLRAAAESGDTLAPAEALQRAQVDMLRSGAWRSSPSYWAAYGLLGRSN
jgi:CHAT domain-containing protein